MDFSSVKHVYESLNGNAQKIFVFILKKHVEGASSKEATVESKNDKSVRSKAASSTSDRNFLFSELYMICREEFLVNSEVTLRAQLSEFRDHNLLKIKKGDDGRGDIIVVLVDKAVASRFLESLE